MEAALPSFREWTASTLRTCQEQRGPNSSHPGNRKPKVRMGDLACRTARDLVGRDPDCGCHPAGKESFRADGASHRKAEPPVPASLYGIYHQVGAGLHVTLRSRDRHFYSSQKNYRRGEEHGSARWGDARQICKKYSQKPYSQNILLTQNFRISLDTHKHRRCLNILVVGGSGAGKSRGFALPNIMQCCCSMVITDPKAELLRKTGGLLEKRDMRCVSLTSSIPTHLLLQSLRVCPR